jgi:hypothetical protein
MTPQRESSAAEEKSPHDATLRELSQSYRVTSVPYNERAPMDIEGSNFHNGKQIYPAYFCYDKVNGMPKIMYFTRSKENRELISATFSGGQWVVDSD